MDFFLRLYMAATFGQFPANFGFSGVLPRYVMSFSNRAQRFTGSNYLEVDSPLENKEKVVQLAIN